MSSHMSGIFHFPNRNLHRVTSGQEVLMVFKILIRTKKSFPMETEILRVPGEHNSFPGKIVLAHINIPPQVVPQAHLNPLSTLHLSYLRLCNPPNVKISICRCTARSLANYLCMVLSSHILNLPFQRHLPRQIQVAGIQHISKTQALSNYQCLLLILDPLARLFLTDPSPRTLVSLGI